MALGFHFKCTQKCHLQFISIWTNLKYCRLVMGYFSYYQLSVFQLLVYCLCQCSYQSFPVVSLLPVLHTIFLWSHWLLSHRTIIRAMNSGEWWMNPLVTTTINAWKEISWAGTENQLPSGLKLSILVTMLPGLSKRKWLKGYTT